MAHDLHDEVLFFETSIAKMGRKLKVYLFYIDGLLIDTGPSRAKHKIIPFISSIRPQQIVLTHHHEDHTGLAPWIQKNLEVPIFIHADGIPICHKKASPPLYRKLFWGDRGSFQPIPLHHTLETNHHSYEVIHTPGHAHDHIVLLNHEKGILFSGDLYVSSQPKTMFAFESASEIMKSIRLVLKYDFSVLYCNHAGRVQKGKEALLKKLHYLEEIEGQVDRLYKKGMNSREITKQLFPHSQILNSILTGNEMSPMHIVQSFLKEK